MNSIQEQLNQILSRAISLHGFDLDAKGMKVPAEETNKTFLKALASMNPDPQEQVKIIKEAWGDKDKMKALNALRVEQVQNFIAAEATFSSAFFSQVTLADDEEPTIINETKNEWRIGHIAEDGHPDRVRVIKPGDRSTVALAMIASDWVRYKTWDIYKGRIDGIAKATLDIAFNLTWKLETICRDLMAAATSAGGCFGVFSYEQALTKPNRIYVAHSGIVTAHLPTTNSIDLTAAPYNFDKFQVGVLRHIVNYADSWGQYVPDGNGQRLVPTGDVIVPASDIIAIADTAEPAMNASAQRIQEEINANGYTSVQYLGKTWRFIGDVTIAKGTCYPRFNMLPGVLYKKRGMSGEFVKTDEVEMWEERMQRQVYGAVIIHQRRPRALKVIYA